MLALTRAVPESIGRCELTHLDRLEIDVPRARAQHAAYEAALAALGCKVERVRAADLPDSVFIEDTAVVLDEVAIVTRPGAESRRGEIESVEAALSRYRPLERIAAPGTVDGGDVLRIGRVLYVGVSGRTDEAGIRQLAQHAGLFGYSVVPVEGLGGCLHLKSAVTDVDDGVVVINPEWIDGGVFGGLRCIEVDPGEPHAANVLRIGRRVLCAASAPRTEARLTARGIDTLTVDVSELAKAEGALTCCSVIVRL